MALLGATAASAQLQTTMVNGDTIHISACQATSGVIYDDGGPSGDYSNSFEGWVAIEASAGITITISGNYDTESGYDHININDGDYNLLEYLSGSGALEASSTTGVLIVHFKTDGSSRYSGFALNWTVEGIIYSCSNSVSALSAGTITNHSVALTWTADNAAGPFTVTYNGRSIGGITTTSYTLDGLASGTFYNISVVPTASVQSLCCGDYITLRTACGNSTLPIEEGFEGIVETGFPECWVEYRNFDQEPKPQIVAAQRHSGQRSLMLSAGPNTTSGHMAVVASQPVDEAGPYHVTLWLMASHSGTNIEIGTCDTTSDEGSSFGFIPQTSLNLYNNGTWQRHTFVWTPGATGRRLALRMRQDQQSGGGRRVYIDDVEIENCGVEDLAVSQIDETSMVLSWALRGTPTCRVGVRHVGGALDELVFNNAVSPLTINGLTANTRYQITVYPDCGTTKGIPRSTIARTIIAGIPADSLCADFHTENGESELPSDWTFFTTNNYSSFYRYDYRYLAYYVSNSSQTEGYMVSPRLSGLAGKDVAVRFNSSNDGRYIIVGTMYHPDDTSTFVPVDTIVTFYTNYEHGDSTVVVSIPSTSTGRHLALKFCSQYYWYENTLIAGIQVGTRLIVDDHVIHRRATEMVFDLGDTYDTIYLRYCRDNGPYQVDTFYNTRRPVVYNLTPNSYYQFTFYRPGTKPCDARTIRAYTTGKSYDTTYCETFNSIQLNDWRYYSWETIDWVSNFPRITYHNLSPYHAENTLEMASWGFDWGYRTRTAIADVPTDSNTVLSFFVTDNMASSDVVVYLVNERYVNRGDMYHVVDTIHMHNNGQRRHYSLPLPSDSTLFFNRIVLHYLHHDEYNLQNAFIDNLQLSHAAYGNMGILNIGYDTATISFDTLYGADSLEVMIIGDSTIYTIAASHIDSIGLGGLDTGTLYFVYARPQDEGCFSYSGYFITNSNVTCVGDYCYNNCFPFTGLLSDELPYHWAATDGTIITNDDRLQMNAGAAVTTNPILTIDGALFTLRGASSVHNDTVLVGYLPQDSIDIDSTHFSLAALQPFITIVDTLVLDTVWQSYITRLSTPGVDSVRLCIIAGNGLLTTDNIGWNTCLKVDFEVDGNTLVCTVADDPSAHYMLYVTDSEGDDNHEVEVFESPYRLQDLKLGTKYYVTYRCLHTDTTCSPIAEFTTGNTTPLPYCLDFDNADYMPSVPKQWTYIDPNPMNSLRIDMNGPSVYAPFSSYSTWTYTILPLFEADSSMSMYIYLSHGINEIGYLANGMDTSSFVTLESMSYTYREFYIDYSQYTDKHIAIRHRGGEPLYIYRIHVQELPLVEYRMLAYNKLEVTASNNKPYYITYTGDWSSTKTTVAVDTNVFLLTCDRTYYTDIQPTDSLGNNCNNHQYFDLSTRNALPACYNNSNDYWVNTGHSWHIKYYGSASYRSEFNGNDWTYTPFFNTALYNDGVIALADSDVDSVRHLFMSFSFTSGLLEDSLEIGVLDDALDEQSFTPVDTVVYTLEDNGWQHAYVSFENYSGNGRWVAFRHRGLCSDCSNETRMYIDTLSLSSCPSAVATASLRRWNQVIIDAELDDKVNFDPFVLVYGPDDGSSNDTMVLITQLPTILVLSPETPYHFNFWCDSNYTGCSTTQHVKTLTAPLSVPSCINFDTVTVGTAPRNWNRFNTAIVVGDEISHTGNNSLEIPIGLRSYIATPDIDIDSLGHLAVSLWFKVEDIADRLVVGTMSNPTDLSTFHPLRTLSAESVNQWQRALVEFSDAPSGHYFLALRARSNKSASTSRNVYVDDIYLDTCGAFNIRVQRAEFDAITLEWSQVGNPSMTIEVIEDSVVIRTITPTTHPATIADLTTHHNYKFRFTSSCNSTTGYCTTNYVDSVSLVTPSEGRGCVNPTDLYSAQATFFRGTYQNPYSAAGAIDFGSADPESRHTVHYDTTERDQRTNGLLRTIPEGYTSSVRLGNWNTNLLHPEAEGVIYSLLVDTSSFQLLMMNYAAVLQDPQHATVDQPRFRLELLDSTFHIIDSACTSADFIADQSLGWNTAPDGVLWKDWTSVGIDLTAHANEQVYVRLTTFDCNEGSHYGYAYFTLECRPKQIETSSCGDIITNTLTAPAGFNYRWYKANNPTTVGTTQSITIPSEDIMYYCDLSFIDNPACTFTLSAYGGTRYPMASFDTSMYIDSCLFHVSFTNTSTISVDHITPMPGSSCESAYWDFGNGEVSTGYHGSTVYSTPGTYTVKLISGIAEHECEDTAIMLLHLTLPDNMMPSDTVNSSICDNQFYQFYNLNLNQPGTYYKTTPTDEVCDSLHVLYLDVRATSNSDTTAHACDSIVWRGSTYHSSGDYITPPVGLNAVGCDSTVTIHLTVTPNYDTVDSIVICPGYSFIYNNVDYGGPANFDTNLFTRNDCDSIVHVSLLPRDSSYHIYPIYSFDSTKWNAIDSIIIGCTPDTLFLKDTTSGSPLYEWNYVSDDTIFTTTDSDFFIAYLNGSDSLTALASIVVTDIYGCHDTVAWPIIMFQSPTAEFEWAPTNPPMHNPEAAFINLTYQPDTLRYLWNIQKAVGGAYDTSTLFAPFYHWGAEGENMAGDYRVVLTAYWDHSIDTMLYGDWFNDSLATPFHYLLPSLHYPITHTCIDSTDNIVTITNEYLQFPNLVTPNGDGNNDTWKVVNLIEFGNYSMNELWIYDRWGVLVYHVKNITTEEQFWDPNSTNSPDGTYYYRFLARSLYGSVKRNGLIEVLRD